MRHLLPLTASALAIAVVVSGCSRSAQTHFDRGQDYAQEGNDAAAILEYRNAIEKDATFAQARVELAELYMKSGNGPGALAEYVRAADLLPNDEDVQLKAGSLLLAAGRAGDARACAERVLAADPANAKALLLRASALAGLSDLDGAIAQVQDAMALQGSAEGYATLGLFQEAKGRPQEAEAALRQAVTTDPRSVTAQLALGQFLRRTGRANEAEAAFKSALAVEAGSTEAHRALASLYVATNRASEAEAHFKSAAESSESPAAKLTLADYYVSVKRNDEALAVLEQLSNTPGTWATAKEKTAALLYSIGRKAEAQDTINEVLTKEPGNASARVLRGRLLLADGKADEALVDVTNAVASNPTSAEAHMVLGLVQQSRKDFEAAASAFREVLRLNPRASAAQVRLAELELQTGSAARAMEFAEGAVQTNAANVDAQLVLARALLAQGNLDRATTVIAQLLKTHPQMGAVHVQAGLLSLRKRDARGARAAFERAVTLDPASREPLAGLATLDIEEGNAERARSLVEARLQQAPRDSALLVLAARTRVATGDQAKAEEFLRRAIESDAANFQAYAMLAGIYASQRRLDDALVEYDKMAARQPGAVGPETLAGLILQAQGKGEEARRRYERLVEVAPHAAVASNNLAWMYASRGEQLDRALELAQAAKANLPDEPDVDDTLAFVYIKKQLAPLAIPLLQRALQKRPDEPVFHYHLGMAHAQTDDKVAAKRALEQALTLSADFDGAHDARELLRSLL